MKLVRSVCRAVDKVADDPCLVVALLQFATVLCDACGTPVRVRMPAENRVALLWRSISFVSQISHSHGHPLLLCLELLLDVVMYSSSGRHSSG